MEPRAHPKLLWQVDQENAEERAQLSAKMHLVKAAHKRMKADLQAQVDMTAATAAQLALSQVCSPALAAKSSGSRGESVHAVASQPGEAVRAVCLCQCPK